MTETRHPPGRDRLEDERNRNALALFVQRRGASAERHIFRRGFAVIGSAEACPLRLGDPSVPLRALYVQRLIDRVVVVDLACEDGGDGSQAVLSEVRCVVHELPAGRAISVGPFELWHSAAKPWGGGGLLPAEAKPLPSFAEPVAAWEIANVKGDDFARKSRHIRHALTLIGRGPACRFRMVHKSISGIHAGLVSLHGHLRVIDLCSEHGVHVNGRRVSYALLHDGDELRIGHCHGVIRCLATTSRDSETDQSIQESSGEEPVSPRQTAGDTDEGIIVSLSEQGIDVRQDVAGSSHDLAAAAPQYSEEDCLALVAQFLDLQRSMLEHTQLLMRKISERLQTGKLPIVSGEPAALQDVLPESDDQADSGRSGMVTSASDPSESEPSLQQPPVRRKTKPSGVPNSAPAPEFHAWLTHQLADLESSQRSGFSRLWQRLTGLK